jgi:putative transposase
MVVMELQRTIRLKLRPDAETVRLLEQTTSAYTSSFNAVARLGWDSQTHNGVTLHHQTYYTQRETTGLPAQLVVSARMRATEALKSVKARLRAKKKACCPYSVVQSIRYDMRSYSIWFERCEVSIVTLRGRVKIPFRVPDYYNGFTEWRPTSADLIQDRKGRWWFHVVMASAVPGLVLNGGAVGVDLGIANPAVDSTGNFYGSGHWKVVEDRIFQYRRALQAKGTKSARRRLKALSGRQRRFRKDCDHVLSKRLVQSVSRGDTLVFEDLTDIRARAQVRRAQRRRLHGWSFHQLQSFVEYKASALGVNVEYVDARYTSQKCSSCGHTERKNRPDQSTFCCVKCGFMAHADLNAACNIRDNYIKGLSVNQPIVSGGVTHPGTSTVLPLRV